MTAAPRPARLFARRLFLVLLTVLVLAATPLATARPPLCDGQPATITGTAEADFLTGSIRADVIWGGRGDDHIAAGSGDDLVCAGPGDDVVTGAGGDDTLLGGGGDDQLDGGSGHDRLVGGPGRDLLLGGAGDDHLAGGGLGDILQGGPGADTLSGGPGADNLDGGDGADRLFAGAGNDHLAGGRDADLLQGGPGRDALDGGEGDDTLAGGEDDDTLQGGAGTDSCDGGPGRDSAATCERVRSTEQGQVPEPLLQPGPHQVALTFDDGPSYSYTSQILDILARYEVPATFFIVGRHTRGQLDLVRRIAADGHSVQNHTYDHYRLTSYSDAVVREQLAANSTLIANIVGIAPRCMRPPYGAVNDRVRAIAEDLGLATIMWDVNPSDWTKPGAGAVASRVLSRAGGGDIVLLHDLAGGSTIGALPSIIEGLRTRGLEFVSLCTVPGTAPRQTGRDGNSGGFTPR